jgi:hypothetical protein
MGQQVSKRVDSGLTTELAGKDRGLSTELRAELGPVAVVRHRSVEVKRAFLDESKRHNSGERFRDRGDVERRLGRRRNAMVEISVAQSRCENDLLVFDHRDRQSRNAGCLAEGVELLDEGWDARRGALAARG